MRSLRAPLVLTGALNVALLPAIGYGVLPVLLLLPVQRAINRLNGESSAKRWTTSALELLVVAIGAFLQWGHR